MALINCPECGKTVSNSAQACPICGYPIAKKSVVRIRIDIDDYLKHTVCDSYGNVLGVGYKGDTVSFSVDKPISVTVKGGGYFCPTQEVRPGDRFSIRKKGALSFSLCFNQINFD